MEHLEIIKLKVEKIKELPKVDIIYEYAGTVNVYISSLLAYILNRKQRYCIAIMGEGRLLAWKQGG